MQRKKWAGSISRRSFLKLPALLPLVSFNSALSDDQHHFQYEGVIGTSLDLVVSTPHPHLAQEARRTVLKEIDRLDRILNTRNPSSEICLLENERGGTQVSHELAEVLDAYEYWERRTNGVFSIYPEGIRTARNVDALGKAYIIDRAAEAVRKRCPSIDSLLLNIGGDITVWGRPWRIAIADPGSWYDNAAPFTTVDLQNAAIATSGTYARGAHLKDARSGQPFAITGAASVIAPDTVTANALATTVCLTHADHGIQLVEATAGAEAIFIATGLVETTSGFARLERREQIQTPPPTNWPAGYKLTITLPLTARHSSKRPYVGVWVENSSGRLVRILAFWANKSKYYADLSTLWNVTKGNVTQLHSVARATRQPGKYELMWDGLDQENRPVQLGKYQITVETNQEHGTYGKQTGTILLGEHPASITLPATANFDQVSVEYGPR